MRMTWLLLGGALALAGCDTRKNEVLPPEQPKEFVSVPKNDPRYNEPPRYPKEVLERDGPLKKKDITRLGPTGKPQE